MRRAGVLREFFLERRDFGALRDPARENDAAGRIGLALVHHRADDRNVLAQRDQAAFFWLACTSRPGGRDLLRDRPGRGSSSSFSCLRRIGQTRRGTAFTLRSGPNSAAGAACPSLSSARSRDRSRLVSTPEATLNTSSGDVGFEARDVRAGDVFDVHEVHRSSNRRPGSAAAGRRRCGPSSESALRCTCRGCPCAATIHVEVARGDIVQSEHVVGRERSRPSR